MATGTPTLSDSFFLAQSTVFTDRVKIALFVFCNTINSEVPTGVTGTLPNIVHDARKSMVANILVPGNFTSWLPQFVYFAASDGNVIAAATQATTNYTAITTQAQGDTAAADGQTPLITTVLISNAIAASFNSIVPNI